MPIDFDNLSVTSDDVRLMEHVVDDMTTEIPPMSTVFAAPPPPPAAPTAPPPAAPPPPPPPPPPAAAAAPASPTPASPTPTPTPAAAAPRTPSSTAPNSPHHKKSLKLRRKRKREEDEQPRPTPPLKSPTSHQTLNCRSGAFRDEISNYIEFLRPGWEEQFTDGVMQFLLITAYRYATHHAKEKFAQWKKTKYDVSEMLNVTSLCSVEHARHFTEHALKIILIHAALTACHTRDAPPLSRSTIEMVQQVAKFDYTVDGVGLAMMCDGLEQISTTNFLQLRHSAMLASGEEDNDIAFPFRFELNKYEFNSHY